ncbi:bifunctional diguanylate cyclase/phosphodiesterase [Halomonas ramblicola]|uniref:bifunctional diguanylate cyclase/phosphodiesterase n=1 Tax=Halomonas ramblicola TaxID=747349 RepID=UPI0025B369E1|nr:EAL domain-containing protein [Halomonas ramblicola]MDN3523539.1 EAL domain-containing protein [Halomonas ramblicola]
MRRHADSSFLTTSNHRREWRRAIGIYLVAVLLILATLAALLVEQYRRDVQAADERTAVRADLVAEWVASTFASSEALLQGLATLLEQDALAGMADSPEHLGAWLVSLRDGLSFIDELCLVGPEGRILASTDPAYSPGQQVGELLDYHAALGGGASEELVTPLFRPSGDRFRVVHARRLSGGGIISAQLDLASFAGDLERLSMARGQSTALIDTDMRLIARRPAFSEEGPLERLGKRIEEPLTRDFIDSGADEVQFRTASPLDGEERLYTLQRIGELPFVAVVGEAVEIVLADWLHGLWGRSAIALVVILLGGVVLRHYLNRLSLEAEVRRSVVEREQARREAQSREARLEALVGSIQDTILVFDERRRFVYAHATDPGELVVDAESLRDRHYREVLPVTLADRLDAAFDEMERTGQPVEYDYRMSSQGQHREYHAVLSPLVNLGQDIGGALAVVRDVTEERATEAQLRIAATAFETHLGMLITDAEGNILRINDTFSRITGYREEDVLGKNPRLLSSGMHDATFYRGLWASVLEKGNWQGEIWNRRKNGEVYPEWLTISAVHNAAGELTHYVATFSDLTERKAAEQEIHQLAFYDPLTGLPNRRLMLDRLEGVLRDSYRTRQYGALVYLDLDNFKQVNDTQGHHRGDQLLQTIAERLGRVVREADTLARLGGDEFALLFHDLGREVEAAGIVVERIARKLLGVLQHPILLGDESVAVTGSLGITLIRDQGTGVDEILQQADMALFQAKATGRNTLSFFDPDMQVRLQARARLEADLRQALPRREFRLHYQPQVAAGGAVVGVEAVLRWEHPERGLVSPGEFIPLAEENRLIVVIGYWALDAACRQLAAWATDPQRRDLSISVNVSPRQFRELDFVEQVLAVLAATRAPAERLKLEVTETLFMEERDDARAKMLRLRERGVSFSLDDFGTGYSSLAYLKQLPLDQLKIDQSFVRDLLEEDATAAIVASTIALARSLGLEVVAEGVETRAQHDWLVEHGCRRFQGYLFGRPLPLESLRLDPEAR